MIVMGQEEYASHIQAFQKDAAYLNITIANYVELEIVCGLGHATGEWAKSGNSQTPLATQQIHVGDDEPSQFMDIGVDGSMPTEWSDMQVMEDSTTTTKKPLPSSRKGGGIKRKSKTSGIDQDIRECISLMDDSVNEVANAIKSSTSPQQIRNMYNELMFELKNISGFSEEEVDTIYDNLSKNPTLIPSFLSKPADSKARWMPEWWSTYGGSCPNLTRLAIHILSQTCSARGPERTHIPFEQLHNEKLNFAEHQRLCELVYVRYNLRLQQRQVKELNQKLFKKQFLKSRCFDPISVDNIDIVDEWVGNHPLFSPDADCSSWWFFNQPGPIEQQSKFFTDRKQENACESKELLEEDFTSYYDKTPKKMQKS
ncbi:hypothetical protein M5K25_021944 [Dendrobium thyrsiflorum]|uniref:HAT C-terminal dimerisation domain-containing protein n=1 Tax=Dendrobium thyrsiflorum TaxID=117978 RepID=A0ABD0U5C3_DENTH